MDSHLLTQHRELEESHWWFSGRKAILRDTVARSVNDGRVRPRILDVGCGPGGMVGMLLEFCDVTVLDSSPGAILEVRRRYPSAAVAVGHIPAARGALG